MAAQPSSSPSASPPLLPPDVPANPFADDDGDDHGPLYASQQEQITRQDEHLDNLTASIARQQQLSLQMGDELDLHHDLLNEFDQDAERTGLRLGGASDRLETLRRSVKENGSTYLIFGLIIVLVLLIAVFK
ncbi:uncharacterized protein PFL1_06460 [Pseudozyma flocculosa PF-1]|uniref:t-SNARE coiled-coil homology domain-containing protein n=2 Tax=Pseudozyma flocculosa TaxID=84751 RepID=A0A5C3EWZ4_9BASI|nr:uncharacterized protein PFL1_06460 [Pseudozyma flocculosa PF-1]EPQ26006.1 hypothetical protein PFL1_06460 [Pseudozyma flocculosa PF-1]SPO35689.1 uncharacterized protein PSFLO_01160 [Pseudozyma flocculosa]